MNKVAFKISSQFDIHFKNLWRWHNRQMLLQRNVAYQASMFECPYPGSRYRCCFVTICKIYRQFSIRLNLKIIMTNYCLFRKTFVNAKRPQNAWMNKHFVFRNQRDVERAKNLQSGWDRKRKTKRLYINLFVIAFNYPFKRTVALCAAQKYSLKNVLDMWVRVCASRHVCEKCLTCTNVWQYFSLNVSLECHQKKVNKFTKNVLWQTQTHMPKKA